jgi:hypothetical protein
MESILNAIRERLAPFRQNKARFAVSVALVLAALGGVGLGEWAFGTVAASLFALTVAASATLFGLVPGMVAAICATLALDFFFLPPIFEWTFSGATLRIGLVMLAVAVAAYLIERRISENLRSRVKPELGIFAHLDGVENGIVSGWAYDADHPNEPLALTVFVNKHPVAYRAAVHYRPDVAESMKCSGQYGFYVDLAEHFREGGETLIEVRLPNGWLLEGAPAVIRSRAVQSRASKPTVLFMHIPKTAGTAFREAIASNFLLPEIAYLYPGPPGFLVSDLRALPLEQRRAFRIVIGHYQVGMHESLPQEGEYITVVREPGARILSQYRYLQQTQPEAAGTASLEELFEKRFTVDFDNAMVRCFSGADERIFPPGTLTSDIYDQAVRNLRSMFRFVGYQEHAAHGYEWLCNYYGWHATEALPSVNLGTLKIAASEESKLSSLIRHYNELDYLFYEEIQRVFPKPDAIAMSTASPQSSSASRV